jgi:hypothetical protein
MESTHSTAISFGGKIDFNEHYNEEVWISIVLQMLYSAENRFYIKPSLQFDVMDESIKTDITVDYVGEVLKIII